ncbi:hypothetical protein DZC31_30320 (plasmid) [Stenotrophomonas rhizophila]|nr:hypothetical protein DZC31_30320 [Stenotrophomonas rhizophila]
MLDHAPSPAIEVDETQKTVVGFQACAVPSNMVSSTPDRLNAALAALQSQARSASELIGFLKIGVPADDAKDRLRNSQEVINGMPNECFIIVEAARLLGKPIPHVSVQDLAFTGLIALDWR